MTKLEKHYLSLLKKVISQLDKVIKDYPYIAENCENNNGKPCKRCKHILDSKKLVEDINKEINNESII